jgi:hypothetical protein
MPVESGFHSEFGAVERKVGFEVGRESDWDWETA